MEEYNGLSAEMKKMLEKAESLGWWWQAYIEESQNNRTYMEIGKHSPAGEDFSMTIDFKSEDQCSSFMENLKSCCEDFDIDEHIEMWIGARSNGVSGVPSARELVEDAEAILEMIKELHEKLEIVSKEKEHLKVGNYIPPDENGGVEVIEKEFYGQGMIFKSDEAFYDTEHPDKVCYIPELSDATYTRNSILTLCNGQTDLAEEVYEAVDWQHPESLIEDWYRNGELDTCKKCGKMFNCYGVTKCPYCGADYEGGHD